MAAGGEGKPHPHALAPEAAARPRKGWLSGHGHSSVPCPAPSPCQASPARCPSCTCATSPSHTVLNRLRMDTLRHLSPSQSRVLSILLPAGCTTSCFFQHLTLALHVHCTESSPKMTRFLPVPTRSPLCHGRHELIVRSSCATT